MLEDIVFVVVVALLGWAAIRGGSHIVNGGFFMFAGGAFLISAFLLSVFSIAANGMLRALANPHSLVSELLVRLQLGGESDTGTPMAVHSYARAVLISLAQPTLSSIALFAVLLVLSLSLCRMKAMTAEIAVLLSSLEQPIKKA